MKFALSALLVTSLFSINSNAAELNYDLSCKGDIRLPNDAAGGDLKSYIKSDFSEEKPKLVKFTAGRSKRPIGPAQDLQINRIQDTEDTLTISGPLSIKFAGGGQASYELKVNKNTGDAIYTTFTSTLNERTGRREGDQRPHPMTCTASAR